MKSTGGVVFRGITEVVEAYEANDIGPWALIIGNDVFCACELPTVEEGKPMLEETLRRLHKGNSRVTFDLRVYKLKGSEEIDSSTKHFRGFRFSLYQDSDQTPYEHGRRQAALDYEPRFEEMRKEIEELKGALAKAEEMEEDEKPSSVNQMISGILEMPNVKQALSMKLIGLIDKIVPMNLGGGARPAAIAGVPASAPSGTSLLDSDQQQKVQQAVNILCTKDAKLGDHLLGVANIAISDPDQYKWLIKMLK
jgi:hypothetical protein